MKYINLFLNNSITFYNVESLSTSPYEIKSTDFSIELLKFGATNSGSISV